MPNEPLLSEAKRELLERMRRTGAAAPSDLTGVQLPPREHPVPLSLSQEEVWRLDQTAGKLAPLHNESITIHRKGACDPELVQRSLTEIVRRHEIWRTTYAQINERLAQIIHPAPESFPLAVSDLRNLPESERDKAAVALATEDATLPFDLAQGPLVRARLITLRDDEHRISLSAHQSVVDGITVFDVFPVELTALYESFTSGQPSPLPELRAQFADFACWQRQRVTGEAKENQLAYWQRKLGGALPVLEWPHGGARPAQQTYRGAMH